MNEEDQEGEEANMDVLPETVGRGKRKVEEEDVPKSQEQFPRRSCPFADQPIPMASQSTNQGCSHFHSHVIEIPEDKVGVLIGGSRESIDRIQHSSGAWIEIGSRPWALGANRRVELRGTREQIQSALGQITGLLIDWYPITWVDSVPDHHLPEPSSYGYINPPGMNPESQPAGSCPAQPSYCGHSSTQPSIWNPGSPSGRRYQPEHAGVRPDLLPDLACYASSSTLARALGRRPPFWPAGSSSLEADLYYQLQPSPPAMNRALGPGSSFPRLSDVGGYHIPSAAWHHPEYPYPTHSIQPAAQYQTNSSGRHPAVPWPGSLFIHQSDLENHPIQPAARYQANPSGRHPAISWPRSLFTHPSDMGNHPIQLALNDQYQANPPAMPPAPWPGSDLLSPSSANYGYQANPSAMPEIPPSFCDYHLPEPVACDQEISSPMPATSQPGTCPTPLDFTPHAAYHKDPISPGFYYLAKERFMRPASQPGTYPLPLFDTTHATTQSQETTSGMPPESSQEIYPAPAVHHNNLIQSEAGDEADSSAMHASTSRKRQRK